MLSLLAGAPNGRGSADGTGAAASFYGPRGVVTDAAGNVYIADSYNNVIRKVTAAGVVTTFAGTAASWTASVTTQPPGWERGVIHALRTLVYTASDRFGTPVFTIRPAPHCGRPDHHRRHAAIDHGNLGLA